jgi:hypothetical protein
MSRYRTENPQGIEDEISLPAGKDPTHVLYVDKGPITLKKVIISQMLGLNIFNIISIIILFTLSDSIQQSLSQAQFQTTIVTSQLQNATSLSVQLQNGIRESQNLVDRSQLILSRLNETSLITLSERFNNFSLDLNTRQSNLINNYNDMIKLSSIPVGSVIYGVKWDNICFVNADGRAISRSAYWELYDLIGTTFGPGDGTTFNLPDLRGLLFLGQTDGQPAHVDLSSGLQSGPSVSFFKMYAMIRVCSVQNLPP